MSTGIRSLLNRFERARDPLVFWEAIKSIGDHRDGRQVVPRLLRGHIRTCEHAAEALGLLGARAAVSDLIASLTSASADVRSSSAYALGQIGDRRALPHLRRLA